MKNEIVVTGSSGYIGRNLTKILKNKGFEVLNMERKFLYQNEEELVSILKNKMAVIHLAGAPILKRWTRKNREEIYNSRVITTSNLVKAIKILPESERPGCFVSASAIGIYRNSMIHTESSQLYDDGFLGKTVLDWENASEDLPSGVRRVLFRTGLVLGYDSVLIRKMKLPFLLGLGGRIGSGRQPFPFIHLTDLITSYISSIEDESWTGIYNLVAPDYVTNAGFTRQFAARLRRPAIFIIPAILLNLLFGKASSLLLESPGVKPEKLLARNFKFHYPDLDTTLKEILDH